MTRTEPGTTRLLQDWYRGDREALEEILRRHLPWIRARVRRRLGAALRARLETGDVVQEAVLRLLRDGPRLQIENEPRLLALLARLVENVLRDQADFHQAQRRGGGRRDLPLPATEGGLEPASREAPPSEEAGRREMRALVRLGLELLTREDREILHLRNWEGLSFAALGERLGVTPGAADMRYRRAARRLSAVLADLKQGRVPLSEEEAVTRQAPG